MDRRQLIGLLGTGSAGLLAGCNSFDSSGTGSDSTTRTTVEGDAAFDLSLSGASSASIDEEVDLTITAYNYGGEEGDLEGELIVEEGVSDASAEFEFDDVASGAKVTEEVTLTFEYADDYVLTGAEQDPDEVSHEVLVNPKTVPPGEFLDLGENLKATITDVRFEQSLHYTYESRQYSDTTYTSVFDSGTEDVLAILFADFENVGTEEVQVDPAFLGSDEVDFFTSIGDYDLSTIDGVDTPPFQTTLQPGQTISGWFLAKAPQSTVSSNGITVGYQRDARETRLEKAWSIEQQPLPEFTLEKWTLPSELSIGGQEYKIVVKNTGDTEGTFRGTVEWKPHDRAPDEYSPYVELEATIEPGKTSEFSGEADWRYVEKLDYRLRPFDSKTRVNYVAPDLAVGTGQEVPDGVLTISQVESAEEIVLADGSTEDTYTPDEGMFVLAKVEFEFDSGVGFPCLPEQTEFYVVSDEDHRYQAENNPPGYHYDSIEPSFVDEWWNVIGCGADTAVKHEGWLWFDVSTDVDPNSASIRYDAIIDQKDVVASWSKSHET